MNLVVARPIALLCITVAMLGAGGCNNSSAKYTSETDPSAEPALEIDGASERLLGSIRAGVPLVETFTLRNRGKRTVHLVEEVKASCGCTKAFLSKTSVPPGGVTELTMNIHPATAPRMQQFITAVVKPTEGDGGLVVVGVGYTTSLPFWSTPASVTASGPTGEEIVTKVRVDHQMEHVHDDASIRVEIVAPSDLTIEASTPEIDFGGSRSFSIRTRIPAVPGKYSAKALVTFDGNEKDRLMIPVEYIAIARARAIPSTMLLTVGTAERTCRIVTEEESRIAAVKCDDQFVAEWQSTVVSREHDITIRRTSNQAVTGPGEHRVCVACECGLQVHEVLIKIFTAGPPAVAQ